MNDHYFMDYEGDTEHLFAAIEHGYGTMDELCDALAWGMGKVARHLLTLHNEGRVTSASGRYQVVTIVDQSEAAQWLGVPDSEIKTADMNDPDVIDGILDAIGWMMPIGDFDEDETE